MKGSVLWLAVVLAPSVGLQAAAPISDAASATGSDLLGTWQVCGNARIDSRDTNPRGVENFKLVFRPDATVELRPADATGPARSEFGRFEPVEDGVRLLVRDRELGVLRQRSRDERVLTRDDRDGLLVCRLGDAAVADRRLQPRSVAFYRSVVFDDPGIAQNLEARRPPAGTLLGTWELARVVVRDPAHAWFGSNPYGWGHLRIAFDGAQLCFATLAPEASAVDRGCVPAQLQGLRVRADADPGGMLTPWLAGEVSVDDDGVMRVPRRVYDEEYVWLGPDDLTRAPLEGRITLVTFSDERD